MKLLSTDIFGFRDKVKVRNDVMNYFAKFEKFKLHSIIMPSFMTIGSQMPELDRGRLFCSPPPPYKIGSQNTPYKLGLNSVHLFWRFHDLESPGKLHCLVMREVMLWKTVLNQDPVSLYVTQI